MNSKYGSAIDDPRHWETNKVTDNNLGVVLEQGVIVEYYEGTTAQQAANYYPSWNFQYFTQSGGSPNTQIVNTVPATTGLTKITNREWEYQENEKKREINVLKNGYVQTFINDLRDIMKYKKSSRYITSALVSTENTEAVSP